MTHRVPTAVLFLLVTFALPACLDSSVCPEGQRFALDDGGRLTRVCVAPADAGTDAGPCAACAPELCVANECVECIDPSTCPADRPLCLDNACASCTASPDDCPAETPICDDSGACFECVPGEFCGDNICTIRGRCSQWFNQQQGLCEPCDDDANCRGDDLLCATMSFMGQPRETGFCLPVRDPDVGCNASFGLRVVLEDRVTQSGVEGTDFCGVNEEVTTCEAFLALVISGQTCTVAGGDECPLGSRCAEIRTRGLSCTMNCTDDDECPADPPIDRCEAGYCGQLP